MVALVTGGSGELGSAISRALAASGHVVAVHCHSQRDKAEAVVTGISANGGQARVYEADLHSSEAADLLVERVVADCGGVDVLVNNAGVFAPKPFLESTVADLERFFETNVKGTYLVSQAIVPLMIASGGGAIINVGAALAEQAMTGVPASAVMASKGGVHALTVSLAAELARHRIRVNTIAPGIIRTPLVENPDSLSGIHPLNRIGEVEDTSQAALYLATAGFVTGTTLFVDGGYAHGR
jgi:NAD(P)-dependent dehydrogenase (short-subunit alcohol dehydrogenase family)